MCQCVCGNTQSHRSLCCLRPVPPSISASTRWRLLFAPPVCKCVREGGSKFFTPQMSLRRGSVSVSLPKSPELLAKPCPDSRASYPRLCRRPADPRRAARASSMLPSLNGRYWPRLCGLCRCLNVYVCVSLPLLLRFLGGSSCSGCLPSLSTGPSRNLRHRNFKSRWGRAS